MLYYIIYFVIDFLITNRLCKFVNLYKYKMKHCTTDKCPQILDSSCVFYEGPTLLFSGINTNDSVEVVIQKLNLKLESIPGINLDNYYNKQEINNIIKEYIPLSGTLLNYPVIGNIEFSPGKNIKLYSNDSSIMLDDGSVNINGDYITISSINNNSVLINNDQVFLNSGNSNNRKFINLSQELNYIPLQSNTDGAGLVGQNYYGNNYVDNSFVQKKFVIDTFNNIDLSNFYTKNETYSKIEINELLDVIEVTKTELDVLISENKLEPNRLYKITGVESWCFSQHLIKAIYLKAITNNTLESEGVGEFYTPKHNTSDSNLGIWKGELLANGMIDSLSYNIGDKVIWGNLFWENISGNIGTNEKEYYDEQNDEWFFVKSQNLISETDWQLITPNDDESLYNIQFDSIKYDFQNDYINYRADNLGNVYEISYNTLLDYFPNNGIRYFAPEFIYDMNSIALFQWGRGNTSNNIINESIVLNCNYTTTLFIFNTIVENSKMYDNNFLNVNVIRNTFKNASIVSNYLKTYGGILYNNLDNSYISSNRYYFEIRNNTLKNDSSISNNNDNNIIISANYSIIRGNSLDNNSTIINNIFVEEGKGVSGYKKGIYDNMLTTYCNINSNTIKNGSRIFGHRLEYYSTINSNTLDTDSNIYNNQLVQNGKINNNILTGHGRIYGNQLGRLSEITNCKLRISPATSYASGIHTNRLFTGKIQNIDFGDIVNPEGTNPNDPNFGGNALDNCIIENNSIIKDLIFPNIGGKGIQFVKMNGFSEFKNITINDSIRNVDFINTIFNETSDYSKLIEGSGYQTNGFTKTYIDGVLLQDRFDEKQDRLQDITGNVGVGKLDDSATEKLDVNGYIKATGYKTSTGTENQALTADGGTFDLNDKADLVDGKVPSTQLPSYNATDVDALKRDGSNANSNIDIGEFQLKAGQIELDQTPTQPFGVGMIRWNDTDGTAEIRLKGNNVTLQLGQELVKRVVNKSGANLLESQYKVVKIVGATGQRLSIDLAQANNELNSATTLGMVTENINNNQEGFITYSGEVNGINTTGSLQGETWVDGDILYLSPSVAGGVTKVKPTAPNHVVIVGYVEYAHVTQGKIFIKIDNGYELDEIHNVNTSLSKTNPVDADNLLIQDSADSSIWKKLSWTNIKATLKTYFDNLYAPKSFNVKVTTPSSYVTGTTSETEVLRIEIPANSISDNSFLNMPILFISKIGTNGNMNIKGKLSTSPTMPTGGTDQIFGYTNIAATNLSFGMDRVYIISDGLIKGFPFVNSSFSSAAGSTVSFSSRSFDRTVTNYLYISIQLANTADQARLESIQITNS